MVNKNIIYKAIESIDQSLKDLKKADDITYDKYLKDVRSRRFIERSLHVMIEACIDIAQHIISDEGFREPESYRDSFIILMENKIIPKSQIKTYEKIAMFRNLLVHYYEKIDDEIIYSVFKNNLNDFTKFIEYIIEYMKTK